MDFDVEGLFAKFTEPVSEESMLNAALNSARVEKTECARRVAELSARQRHIDAEMESIRSAANAKIQLLFDERNELAPKLSAARQALKAAEIEVANLERELRLLQERIHRGDIFRSKAIEFERVTAGLKWREFALDHQIKGAQILAVNQRCILADKMGLGKTLTSLIAIDMMQAQRVLIVAPADVVKNYQREVEYWAPHRAAIAMYKMPKDQRDFMLFALKMTTHPVTLLLNYEVWRGDNSVIEQLKGLRFDTVIMDEAHTIKNTATSAYQGMRDIVLAENCCPKCKGPVAEERIGHYQVIIKCSDCGWANNNGSQWEAADRRSVVNVIPMSGTPILNRPQELFPLLHLILPEVFIDERDFLNLYCEQDMYTGYWEFASGGLSNMMAHLSGRYLVRDRYTAGVEIPKQSMQIHELVLDEEKYPLQVHFSRMLSKHAQIILSSGKKLEALAAITMILRKRQMNVFPAGIELKDAEGGVVFSVGDECRESIKVDKCVELITNASPERVVVFSQFKSPLHEIQSRLEALGISAVVFDGDTKESIRERIKIDFDRKTASEDPEWQVVLCNFKTGGVGLNFTAATQMVVLDEMWNPGGNEQAYGRIDRVGQTEQTTVHILRVVNTIDDWMAELIERKQEIVSGMDRSGADLTNDVMSAIRDGLI